MVSLGEVGQRMSKLDNWALECNCIAKSFEFKDFKEALTFVNKVGELAEKESHYPDITFSGRMVKIILTSWEEKGLGDKDFIMAEEIDKITSDKPQNIETSLEN